ncbi:MAG TPA: hypothetical protein VMU93_06825 [Caulobacteraceae bacterium]|nr:hypothetical protein [Caulobacteraceae bacterium]
MSTIETRAAAAPAATDVTVESTAATGLDDDGAPVSATDRTVEIAAETGPPGDAAPAPAATDTTVEINPPLQEHRTGNDKWMKMDGQMATRASG